MHGVYTVLFYSLFLSPPHLSLFPQVRDLVEKCTCPSQFPMVRVSEGKYRIGDTKVLIFVRVSKRCIPPSLKHVPGERTSTASSTLRKRE